jgi:hypothetical protein
VHDIIEPVRPSRSWFDGVKPFGKDPSRTSRSVTEEAAGLQNQRYPHASGRKIRQPSPVLAVHAATNASADQAAANRRRASYRDHEAVAVSRRALNHESARNKLRNVKSLHRLISSPNQSQTGALNSSNVSQTQFWTPMPRFRGSLFYAGSHAAGVGPKRAAQLVQRYRTLDGVLEAGLFKTQAEMLRLYRLIATMDPKAPLPSLADQEPRWGSASTFVRDWGLNQLADRLQGMV